MVKVIGKFTINPVLFVTGKLSGYIVGAIPLLHIARYDLLQIPSHTLLRYPVYILFSFGVLVVTLSLINLGNSTSLGVPSEKTKLKTEGLYRYSRNPMYLGFNLITVSSIILTLNLIVLIFGLYSIIVYHLIIIGEERFLMGRFGKSYSDYCRKVRIYV